MSAIEELRRLIGPFDERDGNGDEEQHWANHPEWPDDEVMLLVCTVGDLRRITALVLHEATLPEPRIPVTPTGILAEAIHSNYSVGCKSHALEECPYARSKRHPVDFVTWASRINKWITELSSPTSSQGENRKSDTSALPSEAQENA